MVLRLRPVSQLHGRIAVPGDKSISHRAVLLNALAPGGARIRHFLASDDCLRSLACVRAYGVEAQRDGEEIALRSPGWANFTEPASPLDCGNSGTTMRLLCGLAAGLDGLTVLDGDASLRARPMDRVLAPLASMGVRVDGRAAGSRAPITVRGGALRPFRGALPTASAQVKSAILIAALAARAPSLIEEPGPTRDHTEVLLQALGADLQRDGARIRLTPGAPLRPVDLHVPGDLSAAAFWLVAASVVADAEITLPAVGLNPTRTGVLDVLTAMGADIQITNRRTSGGEPLGDLAVRSASLRGTLISGDLVVRSIDELPVLAVAAACAEGPTEITGAAELRVKESDRITAITQMLRALGAEVEERPDGLRIAGGGGLHGAIVDSGGDHRIAMAAAVAALAVGDEGRVELHGEDAVGVSYPDFWRHLHELAGAAAIV